MNMEIRMKNPPMDSALLIEVDYGLANIATMLRDNEEEIKLLATNCQNIDKDGEAAQLKMRDRVHNIRNGATELANYLGMSAMLIENLKSDMHAIWLARKEWQQKESLRIAQIEANAQATKKAQIEKERIANKRAEKAAVKKQ